MLVTSHPVTLKHIRVNPWLAHYGIHPSSVSISHGGYWLTIFKVALARANAVLGPSDQVYRHTKTDQIILCTSRCALPTVIHDSGYTETVAPTTYFGSPRTLLQTSHLVPNCATPPNIRTPTDLRRSYNTKTYELRTTGKTKLGIAGYLQLCKPIGLDSLHATHLSRC